MSRRNSKLDGADGSKANGRRRPYRSRLAERLRDALRDEIRSGRWDKTLPSERRLSQEFEVGRPTLHTALCLLEQEGLVRHHNDHPWEILSHEIPVKLELERRPEVIFLRHARAKPDRTSELALIDNLRQKLQQNGLNLVILDALPQGTKQLDKWLSEIETERRPVFYLLCSVPPIVHRWYQSEGLPAMILGSRTDDLRLPAIDFCPAATMRHAVGHLFRRGHRRLLLIQANVGGVGDTISVETFKQSCQQYASQGLHGVVATPIDTPDAVKAAIEKGFARTLLPTAVIAAELGIAIALYAALGHMGLSIPQQVSVLVTCYWPIMDYLTPTPTCYHLPWKQDAKQILRVVQDYQRLGVLPDKFDNLFPELRAGESVVSLNS